MRHQHQSAHRHHRWLLNGYLDANRQQLHITTGMAGGVFGVVQGKRARGRRILPSTPVFALMYGRLFKGATRQSPCRRETHCSILFLPRSLLTNVHARNHFFSLNSVKVIRADSCILRGIPAKCTLDKFNNLSWAASTAHTTIAAKHSYRVKRLHARRRLVQRRPTLLLITAPITAWLTALIPRRTGKCSSSQLACQKFSAHIWKPHVVSSGPNHKLCDHC